MPTRWSWSTLDEGDRVTTPTLEEALRPAEFGLVQALDALALTNDVDGPEAAIETRSRDYLSPRAVAKLSQLLFRLTTEASTIDQAIDASTVEWSASPFGAAGGSGAFAGVGHASPGFDAAGESFTAVEPARTGGAQSDDVPANPFVRFLRSTFQYLRENRGWVLGTAAGALALVGIATSLRPRR